MLCVRRTLATAVLLCLCASAVPVSAATITLIDDHFDDTGGTPESRVGINANGIGTGFTLYSNNAGATTTEGAGTSLLTMDSDNAGRLTQMFSNNAFNPTAGSSTTTTWNIASGSGEFSGRRYVGLRDASIANDDFALPGGGFEDFGFFVTLPDRSADDFGGNGRLGNLMFVDSSLNINTLASWNWGTYTGNNALDISLELTANSYALTLSDSSIALTDGALSGSLTHGLTDARVFAYQQGVGSMVLDRIQVNLELPPIPEPASFTLLGLGMLFVVRSRRRQSRR